LTLLGGNLLWLLALLLGRLLARLGLLLLAQPLLGLLALLLGRLLTRLGLLVELLLWLLLLGLLGLLTLLLGNPLWLLTLLGGNLLWLLLGPELLGCSLELACSLPRRDTRCWLLCGRVELLLGLLSLLWL